MAETLYITGWLQGQVHEVACTAAGGTGSPPVLGWIVSLTGVYDYDYLKAHLGEFVRLFGPAHQTRLYVDATTAVDPPRIDRLVPESIEQQGADVTLHVYGQAFTPRSQIVFNGSPEATVFVSTTELTTTVVGATATTPGAYPVQVQTAPPGGGLTPARWFYVLSPDDVTVKRSEGSIIWEVPAHV